jgi:hypothetical protein
VNFLFLVEGAKTEPKVYTAWLKYVFPDLTFIFRPEDATSNTCRIIAGNGYPNMVSSPKKSQGVSRLEACISDIEKYGNINHFFICIDSEEESYMDRLNEVKSKLDYLVSNYAIDYLVTEIHLIIQHCSMETWALGNNEIPNQYIATNTSTDLPNFKAFYDILIDDPEKMIGYPPGYNFPTRAKFHERYLKEYLKEFGLSYRKNNPVFLEDAKYFNALRKRCHSTNHLTSLRILLDVWDRILSTK